MEKHKIITAKMQGICGKCGKPYPIGKRILKEGGIWIEADCFFTKSHALPSNATSKTISQSGGSMQPASPSSKLLEKKFNQESASKSSGDEYTWGPQAKGLKPNSASPEAVVAYRLSQARKIVAKAFGMKEDELSVENAIVMEAMRELSSEEWLALEREKTGRNMSR